MCVGDIIPEPRPLKAHPSSASSQGPMVIDKVADNTFQYLQLNRKDRKDVAQKIAAWVREVRLQSARHADLLCIRSSQFLSEKYIDASTREVHLLASKDDLKRRLVGWNVRRTRCTVATSAATSESKLRARKFTLRSKGPHSVSNRLALASHQPLPPSSSHVSGVITCYPKTWIALSM